jgi:hypothetical protein
MDRRGAITRPLATRPDVSIKHVLFIRRTSSGKKKHSSIDSVWLVVSFLQSHSTGACLKAGLLS